MHLGEQYLVRANETLTAAAQALSPDPSTTGTTSVSFEDLGPELDSLLRGIQADMKTSPLTDNTAVCNEALGSLPTPSPDRTSGSLADELCETAIDPSIWSFLQKE